MKLFFPLIAFILISLPSEAEALIFRNESAEKRSFSVTVKVKIGKEFSNILAVENVVVPAGQTIEKDFNENLEPWLISPQGEQECAGNFAPTRPSEYIVVYSRERKCTIMKKSIWKENKIKELWAKIKSYAPALLLPYQDSNFDKLASDVKLEILENLVRLHLNR